MSRFEVDVAPEVAVLPEQGEIVRQAAVAALEDQQQEPPAGCTIVLTSDERIQTLNATFLETDKVTDVLSFPAGEPTPGAGGYLGDVAISMPAAERQAASGGHSLNAELQLLTVHAVLHLLGYDHAGEAEKDAMWAAQSRILDKMGAEITGPATG